MNKQERHKLYVSALKNYKENIKSAKEISKAFRVDIVDILSGLCYSLNYCDANYNDNGKLIDAHHDLRKPLKKCVLKEIVKHRPNNQDSHLYWFPIKDTKKRIAILKMAIEETKSDDESMCAK